MSPLDELDKDLLVVGRRVNRLSSGQVHNQKEVMSKFITAENEEDYLNVAGDDDMDYVPIDDKRYLMVIMSLRLRKNWLNMKILMKLDIMKLLNKNSMS